MRRFILLMLLCATPLVAQVGGREYVVTQRPAFVFPVDPEDFRVYSSPFGWRISPFLKVLAYHTGLDIAGVFKATIVAAANGKIVEIWPPPDGYFRGHPVFGGYVVIDHGNGWTTSYSHMSSLLIQPPWIGKRVKAGQPLGRMGATGKAQGPHLHFELMLFGKPLNPALYIELPEENQ